MLAVLASLTLYPTYHLIDLSDLLSNSRARAINNKGEVILDGTDPNSGRRGCYFVADGHRMLIEGVGSPPWLEARSLNDHGYVVGHRITKEDEGFAFVWHRRDGARPLPKLEGGTDSIAYDINENGLIVGQTTVGSEQVITTWNLSSDKATEIHSPMSLAEARVLNNQGVIAGTYLEGASERALTFHLFTLSGNSHNKLRTAWPVDRVTGINDSGAILANGGDKESIAFQWRDGAILALALLPGTSSSRGWALNDKGLAVGYCETSSGSRIACLWQPTGRVTQLDQYVPQGSPWRLTVAWGINEHGDIVGEGEFEGETRAFLLKCKREK